MRLTCYEETVDRFLGDPTQNERSRPPLANSAHPFISPHPRYTRTGRAVRAGAGDRPHSPPHVDAANTDACSGVGAS